MRAPAEFADMPDRQALLMLHLGSDTRRAENIDQIFLLKHIRFHQFAQNFDRTRGLERVGLFIFD